MDDVPVLGVLGGTGLYAMPGLEEIERRAVDTPFGTPSGPIVIGRLGGKIVAFLARHGEAHRLTPSEVNYRANIYALKFIGVERVLAISACGSLREDIAPGDMAVPDQLYDGTRGRSRSFFGDGVVAHLSAPDPFCPDMRAWTAAGVESAGGRVHRGGTYLTIEGPRFSTRGESRLYRAWNLDLIGMTTSPEAFLAREAELCYAVLAHVTDYDVWRVAEEAVTVDAVVAQLEANARVAQAAIGGVVEKLPAPRTCECKDALRHALITSPGSIGPEARKRLGLIVARYLD